MEVCLGLTDLWLLLDRKIEVMYRAVELRVVLTPDRHHGTSCDSERTMEPTHPEVIYGNTFHVTVVLLKTSTINILQTKDYKFTLTRLTVYQSVTCFVPVFDKKKEGAWSS